MPERIEPCLSLYGQWLLCVQSGQHDFRAEPTGDRFIVELTYDRKHEAHG